MNRRRIQSVLTNARRFEPETLYYVASTGTSLSLSDLLTLNEQIKLIKYNGGSVTLSGLTANFSNATGYQFVTNPSSDLRKWIGYYITFTSSVGNTLKVKVSAAGTGENKTTTYTSDFSAGVDSYNYAGGTLDGNIDGIGGQDDTLRLTVDTASSTHEIRKTSLLTIGKKYTIVFKYYIPSGQSNIDGIYLSTSYWGANYGLTTLDAWTTVTVTFTATETSIRLYAKDGASTTFQDAGGDDVFYIKDVTVENTTTPSATGIYFTDPVVTGTFNYNAASYTAVITKD